MLVAGAIGGEEDKEPFSITFNQESYFLRFSDPKANMYEFTPAGQEDLSKWTDMLTINIHPKVNNLKKLKRLKDRISKNYRAYGGIDLRVIAKPLEGKPETYSRYLILVIFVREDFVEFVQSRLELIDGKATHIIYGQRIYGPLAAFQIDSWRKEVGPKTLYQLLIFDDIPTRKELKKLARKR
jgi:hypothetical protein